MTRLRGRAVARVARQLWARDGGTCRRCGGWIDPTLSGLHPDGLTVGHIVPHSRGGSVDPSNLAPEHRRCNIAGGPRDAEPPARIVAP